MTKSNREKDNSGWKSLYRIGGIAVLGMILIVPIQLAIFSIEPPPSTAQGWFSLFHDNAFLGLLSFEVLFIVYGVLAIPVALALYLSLRRTDPAWMALYLALTIVGSAALFSARPAFEMLHLSNQYAVANTEAQRAMYLAAGEGLLAIFHGTSYMISYLLGSITGLILSIVMLRSKTFSRATAYVRLTSSVLDFGLFLPVVGLYVSAFSAELTQNKSVHHYLIIEKDKYP
jgi:hypothetical protein